MPGASIGMGPMTPKTISCVLAATVASLAAMPAFASGGISCESEGGAAAVVIESGVTRGMGSPDDGGLGAVALAVLAQSPVPVTVVRAAADAEAA